jgi:hypothetical protein
LIVTLSASFIDFGGDIMQTDKENNKPAGTRATELVKEIEAQEPGPCGGSSSSVPKRLNCDIFGRRRFRVRSEIFELDEKYKV